MKISKLVLNAGILLTASLITVAASAAHVAKSSENQKSPGSDTATATCTHGVTVGRNESTAAVPEKVAKAVNAGSSSSVRGTN